MLEQLPLGRVRESVELQRVLADVEVGLERDLAVALGASEARSGSPRRGSRRR